MVAPTSSSAYASAGSTDPWRGIGDATTRSRTPAICDGTPVMSAVDGYAALPRGTSAPTRSSGDGTSRRSARASRRCDSRGRCRSWNAWMRAYAKSSARRVSGGHPRGGRRDLLDDREIVRSERGAGRDEVDDPVGETDLRCELGRSCDLHDLDLDPPSSKVLLRDVRVFRGDLEASEVAVVVEGPLEGVARGGDDEAARAKTQVGELEHARGRFHEHVLPDDAEI